MMIDADAHVIESEETWEYMEGEERKFKPRMVAPSQESSEDEFWLIDGRVHIRSVNVGRDTPMASRELRDVGVSLPTLLSVRADRYRQSGSHDCLPCARVDSAETHVQLKGEEVWCLPVKELCHDDRRGCTCHRE